MSPFSCSVSFGRTSLASCSFLRRVLLDFCSMHHRIDVLCNYRLQLLCLLEAAGAVGPAAAHQSAVLLLGQLTLQPADWHCRIRPCCSACKERHTKQVSQELEC